VASASPVELAEASRNRSASPLPGGALVVGGDYRALGVVRSLGRRGVRVAVVREGDDRLSTLSRFARHRFPWPEADATTQVEYLLDLAHDAGLEGWALIPSGDETAALAARYHDTLSASFVVTVPPWEILRTAYDKRETYALADRVGVEVPWTLWPTGRAELEAAEVDFPVILKPAVKESLNRLTAAKAWRVDGRPELLARYEEAIGLVPPDVLMVQELVPGGGEGQLSYAALCADGRPLASIVARRTRQYPADFGRASTFVETIDNPAVEEAAAPLLEAMRFTGLVEVEFKRDPDTERLKLLDVNPRVWGWHTLGAAAGVDFPYLLWLTACRQSVPRLHARPGVRWVRSSTDLPTVVGEILRRRLRLREYLGTLRGARERAIFALDDPLPGLAEGPLIVSMLMRRLLRGNGL
jgi:D-aspartate ligase